MICGRFAAEMIMSLSESEIDAFESLLCETDNDLQLGYRARPSAYAVR